MGRNILIDGDRKQVQRERNREIEGESDHFKIEKHIYKEPLLLNQLKEELK